MATPVIKDIDPRGDALTRRLAALALCLALAISSLIAIRSDVGGAQGGDWRLFRAALAMKGGLPSLNQRLARLVESLALEK